MGASFLFLFVFTKISSSPQRKVTKKEKSPPPSNSHLPREAVGDFGRRTPPAQIVLRKNRRLTNEAVYTYRERGNGDRIKNKIKKEENRRFSTLLH